MPQFLAKVAASTPALYLVSDFTKDVGSRTRDRAKAGPGLVRKIADLTIFNQSKGKSGYYTHAARVGIEDHTIFNQSKGKSGSCAHAARVGM
jgi:hypothetical protein